MKLKKLARELPQMALVLIGVLAFKSSLASMYQVPTGSMIPTIIPGDRLASNQMEFGLRVPFTNVAVTRATLPKRGDIVFFPSPVESGTMLVKRVVAVAGDRLEVRDGRLILNGRAVPMRALGRDEEGHALYLEFLADDSSSHRVQFTDGSPHSRDLPEFTVPEGHFFAMGDNRDNSADSRFFGPVPVSELKGKALGVAFSLDSSGFPFLRTNRVFAPLE